MIQSGIDFADAADVERHDPVVAQMLTLHRQRQAACTPQEHSMSPAQVDATDRRFDRLVHDLYGLTAAEIEGVEGRDRRT